MSDLSPKNSEKLTRKILIDRRLTEAGWKIIPQQKFDPEKPLTAYDRCAIEEYPTANGPADYALCLNGHIVGVVEAKKHTLSVDRDDDSADRAILSRRRAGYVPFFKRSASKKSQMAARGL